MKKLKKDDKLFTGEHREVAAGKSAKDFGPFGRYSVSNRICCSVTPFASRTSVLRGRLENKRSKTPRAMVEVLTARKEHNERQRDALT